MTRQEPTRPGRSARRRQADGQSMAEFALTLPILLLLLCGCIDFGRYIYIDGQVNNNALNAAQIAAKVDNEQTDCPVQSAATSSAGGYTIKMDPNSSTGANNLWQPLSGGAGFNKTDTNPGEGYAYIFPAIAQSSTNCVGTANRTPTQTTGGYDCTGTAQSATTIQKSVIVRITYTFNPITPVISNLIGNPVIEVCTIVPTAY